MIPNLNLAQTLLRSARPAPVPGMVLRAAQNAKDGPALVKKQVAVSPGLQDWGGHSSMLGAYRDWSPPAPSPSATPVLNAGLFGTQVTPPSSPGPVDPDPLDQNVGAPPAPGGSDLAPPDPHAPYTPGTAVFQAPIAGEHWLGGRIAGMDRNTGQPVYDPLGYGYNQYTGARIGDGSTTGGIGGAGTASGNPWTVASKRAGHSANDWVF